MRIIPVLDLLNSVVVRGVAGRRDQYRPVESLLCTSAEPLDVADAFRAKFGLTELYVADLDAILTDDANHAIYETLAAEGFQLLIDCGLSHGVDADIALTAGAKKVIVGLETWPLLSSLEMLVRRLGSERVIFSLDLKGGQLVRGFRDMLSTDALDVAAAVIEAGVRELIVLDVADVGLSGGVSTLSLCDQLREFSPQTSLIAGGGVRSTDDLLQLQQRGLDGVLVASALHNGAIDREQLVAAGLIQ